MSLYSQIRALWEVVGNDLTTPPHLQPIETVVRQKEEELQKLFAEPIAQYNDGLISTVELLDKLIDVAHREVVS